MEREVPQATPPAPTMSGMSRGAPLLSVVVLVMVIDDFRVVYSVKVDGKNFNTSAS